MRSIRRWVDGYYIRKYGYKYEDKDANVSGYVPLEGVDGLYRHPTKKRPFQDKDGNTIRKRK